MAFVQLSRVCALAALLFCSLVVLSLGALLMNQALVLDLDDTVFTISALGISTASITILWVGFMLAIDLLRDGALMSRLSFELVWVGFLSLLWASSAATNSIIGYTGSCSDYVSPMRCTQGQAMTGFLFVGFLVLLVYFIAFLVLGLTAYKRGERAVWRMSVRNGPLSSRRRARMDWDIDGPTTPTSTDGLISEGWYVVNPSQMMETATYSYVMDVDTPVLPPKVRSRDTLRCGEAPHSQPSVSNTVHPRPPGFIDKLVHSQPSGSAPVHPQAPDVQQRLTTL